MRKCPICENECYLFCKKQYEVYKCKSCGFGFTLNTKLQKDEYHRDDEYMQEERLFKNIFQKRVDIISKIMKPGRVLEVGCSTGLLLSLLKEKGWDVSGVELSEKAALVSRERGINVFVSFFEKIDFKEKYDLVIFNHVLEHLKNPEQVLIKTKLLLKEDGFILISLPNFGSLSAKLQKENWPLLLPEEHPWHFTEKSCDYLFGKVGFKNIYSEKVSGIWDYGNPLKGVAVSLFNLKKRFIGEILWAIPTYILSKLQLGSGLIIVAKKN